MPDVPNVPGVPPLTSYLPNNIELLVADSPVGGILQLFVPLWGIYDSNGKAIITPASIFSNSISTALSEIASVAALIGVPNLVPTMASTVEFDFSADSPISNYPQEQGAFQSYDKIQLPSEIGLVLSASGSIAQRQGFLSVLNSLRTSLTTVSILTPEGTYSGYNLTNYSFRRTADRGATMIVADCKFQLIPSAPQPVTGAQNTATISNPQDPSAAMQQALGNIQPQSLTGTSPYQFSVSGWF